jgi:hypothetical protein
MYFLKRVFNPEIFQGGYRKRHYFEGWYFKLIDSELKHSLAVIPGISLGSCGQDSSAFIQVLDAETSAVHNIKYPLSAFRYNPDSFEIEIGRNYFSREWLELDIEKLSSHSNFNSPSSITGRLRFGDIVPFPKTIRRPGIMGPFTFIPFMECYHGVVNIHHDICGKLNILDKTFDFNHGYGYLEKDWGASFPEAWIWLQSNHFDSEGVSLMFSVAKIPWLGRHFCGLISFIRFNGSMYLFATYTKARLTRLRYSDHVLEAAVEDGRAKLEIRAEHSNTGALLAPRKGLMEREILESISAEVFTRLTDQNGETLFEGYGRRCGLEIEPGIFEYLERINLH